MASCPSRLDSSQPPLGMRLRRRCSRLYPTQHPGTVGLHLSSGVHFTHRSLSLHEDYKLPHNQVHVTTCVQCSLYDGMNMDWESKHLSSEIWPVISLMALWILFNSSAPQHFHLQDWEQTFPPSLWAMVMAGLTCRTRSGTTPLLVKILKCSISVDQ